MEIKVRHVTQTHTSEKVKQQWKLPGPRAPAVNYLANSGSENGKPLPSMVSRSGRQHRYTAPVMGAVYSTGTLHRGRER